MNLLEALALENMPDQYRNVVAVKTANKDSQLAKDIKESSNLMNLKKSSMRNSKDLENQIG